MSDLLYILFVTCALLIVLLQFSFIPTHLQMIVIMCVYILKQMYEQLSPLGLCLSHKNTLRLCDLLSGDLDRQLIDAIVSKKRISIVGDNVNFATSVRDERMKRHGKVHNFFGSAVLIHDLEFSSLSTQSPQIPICDLTSSLFIPNVTEQKELVNDYALMAIRVAVKYVDCFKCLDDIFPNYRPDNFTHQLMTKTGVIPLHVLPLNEMHYGDVVKILDAYVTKMEGVYQEAGVGKEDMPNILIGGDQLTRERFSSAKLLRLGGESTSERFQKLTPVVSHFFHMGMKLLNVCFKRLWSTDTTGLSTLHAQKIRLQRSDVKLEVKNAYNSCKDFFVSYTDAHLLEAILTYFNMEDVHSIPAEIAVPADGALLEQWAIEHFQSLVKLHVGTFTYNRGSQLPNCATPTATRTGKTTMCNSTLPKQLCGILKLKPAWHYVTFLNCYVVFFVLVCS